MPDGAPPLAIGPQDRALRIVLPSTLLAVRQTLVQLPVRLGPLGLCDDFLGSIEIVLAEALNNIVEHAYGGDPGVIEIEITLSDDHLNFKVVDSGVKMPGGQVPVGEIKDYPTDPEEMPEGGFGWFLIHDLTAHLSYQRSGDKNILLFGFPCDPVQAE